METSCKGSMTGFSSPHYKTIGRFQMLAPARGAAMTQGPLAPLLGGFGRLALHSCTLTSFVKCLAAHDMCALAYQCLPSRSEQDLHSVHKRFSLFIHTECTLSQAQKLRPVFCPNIYKLAAHRCLLRPRHRTSPTINSSRLAQKSTAASSCIGDSIGVSETACIASTAFAPAL